MLDKKNFYINGKWVSPKSSKEIEVIDPSTEKSCAVISLADVNDVNAAVNAAKNAFESWSFTPKDKKVELVSKDVLNPNGIAFSPSNLPVDIDLFLALYICLENNFIGNNPKENNKLNNTAIIA